MQAISRRITEVFMMTEQCASILTSNVQIMMKNRMQERREEKVSQEWRKELNRVLESVEGTFTVKIIKKKIRILLSLSMEQ